MLSRSLFTPSPAGNSSDLLKRSSIQQLCLILPIPFSKLNGMRSGDFRLEKNGGETALLTDLGVEKFYNLT